MALDLVSVTLPTPTDSPDVGAAKVNAAITTLGAKVNDLITVASGKSIPPTAAFTDTVTGLTVTFDSTGSNAPNGSLVGYAWDFGDSATGTGATASHTYSTAGTYTAVLTVTDNMGRHATVSHTVTLNTAPVAKFTPTPNGLTVTVNGTASTDAGGSISTYQWKFGDGGIATGATATHTYTTGGTYTVTLTVTDNTGLTGTTSQPVTVASTSVAASGGDGGGTGVQPTGSGIVRWQDLTSTAKFSTKVNTAGAGNMVSLPTGTYTFSDFSDGTQTISVGAFAYGAQLTEKGLLGPGSKYVTVEMVPNTSTKAGDVPAQGTGASNQLQYVMITAAGAKVDGIRIQGTSQGHLYNGLRFDHVASPTLTNATIAGIPGNASSPPGETFGVNFQGCTGTVTVTNVTTDGQNIMAAAIGSNNSAATYNITNYLAINNRYSAGWASWEHMGVMNFHGFVVRNSARAFNAERLVGTVNFYDPLWDDPFSGHSDVNPTYEAGWTGGQLNFYFSSTAAWQAFIATRTNKKITAITNSLAVQNGITRNVVRVYLAGVLQDPTNYVQWAGALA